MSAWLSKLRRAAVLLHALSGGDPDRLISDERIALTKLGYAPGTRRSIDVAPLLPPVNEARPREVGTEGDARELMFDGNECTG